MEKHKFNIFPEMEGEQYEKLLNDLKTFGYDASQPIWTYESRILDGWNRYRAASALGIVPVFREFQGSDVDAINFVMRTNKRRNLNKQQLATLAVEADEIIAALQAAIEKECREKQSENAVNRYTSENLACNKKLLQATENNIEDKIAPDAIADSVKNEPKVEYDEGYKPKRDPNQNAVTTKLAETFNTNRTYISEAKKLKESNPEGFEKVRQGKATFQQVKKETPAPAQKSDLVNAEEDFFTELAADHGRKLQRLLGNLQDAILAARNEFHDAGQDLLPYARRIFQFNPDLLILDAQMLKTLKKCPACKGTGCDWCKLKGYSDESEYKSTKEQSGNDASRKSG